MGTHIRIQVVMVADDGAEQVVDIATLDRDDPTAASLGLTLAEGKQVLAGLQVLLVTQQVAGYLAQQRACPSCGRNRPLQAAGTSAYRTLFGTVAVPNPRWRECGCQPHDRHTVRPLSALLPDRTSPELRYLETSWAAEASYGSATKHLHDAFPLDERHSAVTVRNHTLHAAQRAEQQLGPEQVMFIEGCQAQWDHLPIPDGPLAVGVDGGIVRARRGSTNGKGHLFEVIAGKSILSFRRDDPEDRPPSSKYFASVGLFDTKPKRRLFDLLTAQGMQANQQVTFFTDGGDTVQDAAEYLHPHAEYILDWFHLTMRLTVLRQCARGLARDKAHPDDERTLERRVDSVKHYLWHGNVAEALTGLAWLEEDLDCWDCDDDGHKRRQPDSDKAAHMLTYVQELATYITNNARTIVNYGERYRCGERISSGFAESTINQVVSKRMVKKQQMQWTPEGAHLLLQVRTQVLNDDWEATFRSWYPGFRPTIATHTTPEAA